MNEKYSYQYKIKENQTLTLYRVFGDSPHIVLPETINGYPLAEIGPYCFSASNRVPKDVLTYGSLQNTFELCGKNVEKVYLNDSISFLGSHAFYNCRSLKSISLSASILDMGSDVFLNATSLHDIEIREDSTTPTLIRGLLRQISWDVDVHFNNLTLFYPEYYEVYNEIGPAHFFGMNMEGEGFRLRQCIKNNIVDLEEYDSVFEKLCVEESKDTLMHFALWRFMDNPEFYKKYIQNHEKDVLRFSKLNVSIIQKLLEHKALSKETLDLLISNRSSIEEITQLITWKKEYFPIKKNDYSFEDF